MYPTLFPHNLIWLMLRSVAVFICNCSFVSVSALRTVIQKFSALSLPPVPKNNKKAGYGSVKMQKTASIFDMINGMDVVESLDPLSMESVGQVILLSFALS